MQDLFQSLYCWIWAFSDKMHQKPLIESNIPMADLKKLLFLLFFPQPLRRCSHSDSHSEVNCTFSCQESHNGSERRKPHPDSLFPFYFVFFFSTLTLTLRGVELQRALINGSGDAPALRHSLRHNRRSRGAEQGREYWHIEWKRIQNKRAGISPVVPQSPTHCCVFVLRRGVQHSIISLHNKGKFSIESLYTSITLLYLYFISLKIYHKCF